MHNTMLHETIDSLRLGRSTFYHPPEWPPEEGYPLWSHCVIFVPLLLAFPCSCTPGPAHVMTSRALRAQMKS